MASLLYLLWTRPDVSFAVKELSRWMSTPGQKMVTAAKRVLRYLSGTTTLGLIYHAKKFTGGISKAIHTRINKQPPWYANFAPDVWAFSDASWADQHDRKSTGGMVLFFMGCAIMWWCRTLRTVALSSQDAEFMTLSDTSREVVFIQNLLFALGYMDKDTAFPIFGDNRGSITLANNPSDHQKSKHLDVRYFFVRQKVEEERIKIHWVETKDQLADLFTKALPEDQHWRLTLAIMGHASI